MGTEIELEIKIKTEWEIELEMTWGTKTQYIIISENNLNQNPEVRT